MNDMNAIARSSLVVTDYIKANTGEDISEALQQLIIDNPHKTLYFPDGEYILARPVCTPADPNKSVSLYLSCFAVLKAAESWDSDEAMIRLGGIDPFNNINIIGSNYYFQGGAIDGSGIAKGISIDSGRETYVRQVSIKNTTVGLHIKRGANNGSSDCDIENVNIVGNGKKGSVGVRVDGFDNTFTNMRIASVQVGFEFTGGGNFLRNVHPLFIFTPELREVYKDSYAFKELDGGNWYHMCYSDQFATGYRMSDWGRSRYSDCYCMWYTATGDKEVAFEAPGVFDALISNMSVNYHGNSKPEFNAFITVGEKGGTGVIEYPIAKPWLIGDDTYKEYLVGKMFGARS